MAGTAGLPVGVQLVGLPNADELVLYGMKQLETALAVRDVATAGVTLGAAAAAAAAATTSTTVSDVVSKTTTATPAAAATGGAGALTDPTPPSAAAATTTAGAGTGAAPAAAAAPGATAIPVTLPRLRGFCPEHVLLKTVAAVPPSVSLA